MSIPAPDLTEAEQTVAGAILRSPRARRVASASIAALGLALTGVAQTVSILAGNHLMPPDPVWLQITWQWFGLLAAAGGVTWNVNVK